MRYDIQVMRGLAVLAVVVFHIGLFPGGYLGVDAFFVISGFLITTHIMRDLDAGCFSLGGFYLRRIKRLMPACYTTLAVTTLAAALMLTQGEWVRFLKQLVGSITWTANYVLYFQSDYFDGEAGSKPLLHMWSLAVEEQFYVVLPLVLMAAPKVARLPLIVLGVIGGLAACAVLEGRYPSLAFYFLPTRVWELLIGSLGAWIMRYRPVAVQAPYKYAAILVAAAIMAFPTARPSINGLVVCSATLVMLLGQDGWLSGRLTSPLKAAGDWSYSLYLVHWPLLSLANNAYLGEPPLWVRLALGAASVGLAWAQYAFVEQRRFRFRVFAPIAAAMCAVLVVYRGGSQADAAEPCVGFCGPAGAAVAIWGDSYAMQYLPALPGSFSATKSACGPFLGVAYIGGKRNAEWAQECIAFNDAALKEVAGSRAQDVILSSIMRPYVVATDRQGKRVDVEPFIVDTVRRLQAAGKRVTIIGPPPGGPFDIGSCLERQARRLPILGRQSCDVTLPEYAARWGQAEAILKRVAAQTGARLVLPSRIFCKETCAVQSGGQALYVDAGHLTPLGAGIVIRNAGF